MTCFPGRISRAASEEQFLSVQEKQCFISIFLELLSFNGDNCLSFTKWIYYAISSF